MSTHNIYRDMASRTGGKLYIGVVGPVRTGKSSFIKRFMESLVLPNINDPYLRERARDELPQCGSGREIMTAEPKFIPEDGVDIELGEGIKTGIRLMDCVGYMVNGALGNISDGAERMVMTPWYDKEIPMSRAAEEGTRRVICDHSTAAVLVTTDGSLCGIEREAYVRAENKTVEELARATKPFVIILNCAQPDSESARALAENISRNYGKPCYPVNCLSMGENELKQILMGLLESFPAEKFLVDIPGWLEALDDDNSLKKELYTAILHSCETVEQVGDIGLIPAALSELDMVSSADISGVDMGCGSVSVKISVPKSLYYETLSRESGFCIKDDRDLMGLLASLSSLKTEYERVHHALEDVRNTGYGIVMPTMEEMTLEEPQIVRQGLRYGVKLKASAPSIHMIKANIETEVSPGIGGEKASEDVINFLIQGFDGDMSRIWESNIFGKSLNDIAGEGLASKIKALPLDARSKLQNTIQRIINEGSGGLICIIL